MLSREWLEKNQPVNVTGAVAHSLLWLTASTSDVVIPCPRFIAPKDLPNGIAVYCIHGTADRSSSFSRIAARLLSQSPTAISSIHLAAFDSRLMGVGIDNFARQLAEKIKANGHKDIIIMGHSRGGLVAAYYAEYLAAEAGVNVHAIVPICTPFGGSALAIMPLAWLSTSVKQMEKNSAFLTELAAKMLQSGRKYYPVAAQLDTLVPADGVCLPEHRDILLVLDRHGHLSIMTSHRLVRYIRQCLAQVCARVTGEPLEEAPASDNDMEQSRRSMEPDEQHLPGLDDVCAEIEGQVQHLQSRNHMRATKDKTDVLNRLRELLGQMLEGDRGEAYPEADTIGEFIKAYMHDAASNGVKPIDVLKVQLNYPFSIFTGAKTDTETFMENLAEKYQVIRLPPRQMPVLAAT